jgi:hypothetical protein
MRAKQRTVVVAIPGPRQSRLRRSWAASVGRLLKLIRNPGGPETVSLAEVMAEAVAGTSSTS